MVVFHRLIDIKNNLKVKRTCAFLGFWPGMMASLCPLRWVGGTLPPHQLKLERVKSEGDPVGHLSPSND